MLRPPPRLTVSQWADRHRVLSRSTSAEPGPWRTDRLPYMREVMDCFSDPGVEQIVCMFAAQTGKSEGAICNVIGYFIDQDPSAILVVQPREFDARKFSRSRLAPMFRDSQVFHGKVRDPRTRDSENTLLEKTFDGGRLVLAGANSPAGLAGDPIRVILCDEVDRFPASAGSEGDPVELAITRGNTFSNRKVALTSTPTEAGLSRIEQAYELSDQRVYEVPCPFCGVMQALKWSQVKWDHDEENIALPETARYHCASCDKPWTEGQRHKAVRDGEWVAQKPGGRTAGFHLNALYAPWQNVSLQALCKKWHDAQHHPLRLKEFVNTVLAETWVDKFTTAPKGLENRKEIYAKRGDRTVVPAGVVVMTAGADVQDDRIELQIIGKGQQAETWVLQYHVIHEDPTTPRAWERLHDLLWEPLEMERGGWDYIRATAIDTGGHHTVKAYDFCRPRWKNTMPDGRRSFVFAIKGKGGREDGDIWPRVPSLRTLKRTPLYTILVDPLKADLYAHLSKFPEPGPGYIHFPAEVSAGEPLERDYFMQLDSEKCVQTHDARGFPKREWKLKSEDRRNEALDTFVYAEAAYLGLCSMGFDLDREAVRLENGGFASVSPTAEPGEDGSDTPPRPPPRAPMPPTSGVRRRVGRSRFLDR